MSVVKIKVDLSHELFDIWGLYNVFMGFTVCIMLSGLGKKREADCWEERRNGRDYESRLSVIIHNTFVFDAATVIFFPFVSIQPERSFRITATWRRKYWINAFADSWKQC